MTSLSSARAVSTGSYGCDRWKSKKRPRLPPPTAALMKARRPPSLTQPQRLTRLWWTLVPGQRMVTAMGAAMLTATVTATATATVDMVTVMVMGGNMTKLVPCTLR